MNVNIECCGAPLSLPANEDGSEGTTTVPCPTCGKVYWVQERVVNGKTEVQVGVSLTNAPPPPVLVAPPAGADQRSSSAAPD